MTRRAGRVAAAIVTLIALSLAGVGVGVAPASAQAPTPTNLQITPGVESLTPRWNVSSTEGVVGFRLRWRPLLPQAPAWSAPVELSARARRHRITGLSAEPYEVKVRTLTTGGKLGGSTIAIGTPLAKEEPKEEEKAEEEPVGEEESPSETEEPREEEHPAEEEQSQNAWAPVGASPLSDAQAAALVTFAPEQRPLNAVFNDYVPTDRQLEDFYAAKNDNGETTVQWNPLDRYVTGRPGLVDPSTDELIQWAAYKWGIPVDWLRAQYVEESDWYQLSAFEKGLGDERTVSAEWYAEYPPAAKIVPDLVYESMGIAQVKWIPDGSTGAGTEPLRWESTAFNVDYEAAGIRYYYDGYCDWCGSGYGAGQQWNSIGAWEEPSPWGNSLQEQYIATVQRILAEKPWLSPSF